MSASASRGTWETARTDESEDEQTSGSGGAQERRSGLGRRRLSEKKTPSEPVFITAAVRFDVSVSGFPEFEGLRVAFAASALAHDLRQLRYRDHRME